MSSHQEAFDFAREIGTPGPLARRIDPETSVEAGKALTKDRLTEIQTAVLAWFKPAHRAGKWFWTEFLPALMEVSA